MAAGFGLVLGLLAAAAVERWSASTPGWAQACFTPPEDCTALLDREIASARREVLVQAYSFTSRPIAAALEAARRRGVAVRVIMDSVAATGPGSVLGALEQAGIPVLIDDPAGIAHNKVMVIDGERVVTGSFNFTRSAEERNAENLLVLRDAALAQAYAANWESRRRVSVPAEDRRALPRAKRAAELEP